MVHTRAGHGGQGGRVGARDGLGEAGQALQQLGALLVVDADGEEGHAGANVLERQVKPLRLSGPTERSSTFSFTWRASKSLLTVISSGAMVSILVNWRFWKLVP